jgi:hypothetical protein
MFKIGDTIVCFNRDSPGLKYGQSYTINSILVDTWISFDDTSDLFSLEYFISLTEYRKLKIEKICSKMEK